MFPPFVNSFGDQFFAVMINLIGTVSASFFSAIVGAFATNILGPFLQSLAVTLGLVEG